MAEAVTPILEMKSVGKTYSQNGRSIEALRGANLRVKKGEFICLIGATGCADQADEFAFLDAEVGAAQRLDRAPVLRIGLADALHFQDGGYGFSHATDSRRAAVARSALPIGRIKIQIG